MAMPTFDLYRELRVSKAATAEQIAKAFRVRSLEALRREGGKGDAAALSAAAKAYRILSTPKLRARYDELGDAMLDSLDLLGPDPRPPPAPSADAGETLRKIQAAVRRAARRSGGSATSRWIGVLFITLGVLGLVGYYFGLQAEIDAHDPVIRVQIQWIALCDVFTAFGVLFAVTGVSPQTNLAALSSAKRAGLALFCLATVGAIGFASYAAFRTVARAGYGHDIPLPAASVPALRPIPIVIPTFSPAPATS